MGVSPARFGTPRSAPAARSSCKISCWLHLKRGREDDEEEVDGAPCSHMECCIALLIPEVHGHRAALQQGLHHLHLASPGGSVEECLRPHPRPLSLQPRLHHTRITLPYCYSHLMST